MYKSKRKPSRKFPLYHKKEKLKRIFLNVCCHFYVHCLISNSKFPKLAGKGNVILFCLILNLIYSTLLDILASTKTIRFEIIH